ncbi:MAG TPA: DUF4252 domain-containing protein [Thermoanaerobaculia bacterium]|nr:DUF4252 domain-containing protein [Thermoanaerobaculia bacterium]
MRNWILVFALTLAAAIPAAAQPINLDFPGLADRAEEVVDITLDASLLRVAAKFLSGKDADERAVRDMIHGLRGIYVRSYEFAREGEYDRALVDRVKTQLGASWKPLVTVRSKKKENVNIYANMRGEDIIGLVIISAEPREFTVINIDGPVDIERLSSLEGQFGIPNLSKEGSDD